jgi:O-antigen/teichoic acid export membrane protein
MEIEDQDEIDSSDNSNTDLENLLVNKWEDIGYHRIMGGFFYMIIYAVLAFGYLILLPMIIPYSESLGMYETVKQIFASVFTFADFGLASALSRFIAEYRVKDPIRTRQYIRFFIWFQSFSGLIQTTGISIIGLYFLKESYLEYLPWIFICHSLIQFPGWLGVFNEALKGFHQFDKVAIVGVINTIIFQNLTLFIGAQAGVYFGYQNPSIGPVMGAAIGITIGYYVDDFSSTIIAGYLFSKVAKPLGFTIRDVFRWDVPKDVMIESVKFGMGVMLFVFSYQSIGSILVLIYASSLANYTQLLGMIIILTPFFSLSESINSLHFGNHRPSISEAYFNKKQNYCEYILSNGFRTTGQFSGMMTALTIVIAEPIIILLFPQYFDIFNQIFVVMILYKLYFQHSHYMNEVLIGTGNHKFNIIITILENVLKLVMSIIFIQMELGIWVLIYSNILATILKQGIGWIFINRKIVSLHFNWWQMWFVPFLAGCCYYLIFSVLFTVLNLFGSSLIYGVIVIVVLVILGIYILPGPGYFFFLGLFGGYDKNTLEDLRKATLLAGPSKIIVGPWYRWAALGIKYSKLHNKFPMYYEGVAEEIQELMEMKAHTDSNTLEKKKL